MTPRHLQDAFEYEVNKYDSSEILTSDLIFHWINNAVMQYVENLYSNERDSFEETQAVTDDLKELIEEVLIPTTLNASREFSYNAILPLDYLHAVNEEVTISFEHPNDPQVTITKRKGITHASSATVNSQLADPYSSHRLHYESAKPLRLFTQGEVNLLTDGNYTVDAYLLRYLRLPTKVSLETDMNFLPDSVHYDIIKLAIALYLRSIGISTEPTQKSVRRNNNE